MKKCPNCGVEVLETQFICKNCNSWLDNKICRNLSNEEKDLIIVKKFLPVTPSFLAFSNVDFVKEEIASAKLFHDKYGVKTTKRIMTYYAYPYAHVAALCARKKRGKEKVLKEQIYEKFILLAEFIIGQQQKNFNCELLMQWLFSPFNDSEYLEMFEMFKSLDCIIMDLQEDAASQFISAQKFGKIIFGDKCPLDIFMGYYTYLMLSIKCFPKIFLKSLVLEEENFNWRQLILPEEWRTK